jgi:hypothetical protein
MMERREARHGGWRAHTREHFNEGVAALPYDYRSTSRHYRAHEHFGGLTMRQRFAMRSYAGRRRYGGGYSERYRGEMSGGDEYAGGPSYGPSPESERDYDQQRRYGDEGYGDEGPAPEDREYAGSYVSGASTSINAPAALDSWHGYGVDCPPYE